MFEQHDKHADLATGAPAAPGTIGLLYLPPDYTARGTGWTQAWRRHILANADVRDGDYMTHLFSERFPGAPLVTAAPGQLPDSAIQHASTVVLLFADPIGIDNGWLEREIRKRWPAKHLLAVNGRRRVFRLDARAARGLAVRRFLQKARLVEFAFLAIFVLVTPILLLWDFSRGRR